MKFHIAKPLKWAMIGAAVMVAGSAIFLTAKISQAAYTHMGDTDSAIFRSVYPSTVGTKLDSCTTCHSGGKVGSTTYGSCQYCHAVTNYGADLSDPTLRRTLNPYGLDYLTHGRNAAAMLAIQNLDSDNDTFSNLVEINALTYPGDPNDNPSKIAAPSRVFTLQQLEQMPQYSEFLLMNASKSTDYYAEYTGVVMKDLIEALKADNATGMTVFSPDGFATYHPFYASNVSNQYHVFDPYPESIFHYNAQADIATNNSTGWCDYSAPSVGGRNDGDRITNPLGLKILLALKRDGQYLTPGVLNSQNKLDGEGPFRVVPPQKNPGPPDQRSTAANATNPNVWCWPYKANGDHNAGFSSRTVTMIRVEFAPPNVLPPGTTDINTLEA